MFDAKPLQIEVVGRGGAESNDLGDRDFYPGNRCLCFRAGALADPVLLVLDAALPIGAPPPSLRLGTGAYVWEIFEICFFLKNSKL